MLFEAVAYAYRDKCKRIYTQIARTIFFLHIKSIK